MIKYMIHACKQRMKYVEDYLVPSLVSQGIGEDSIKVWEDKGEDGNLKSFLKSMTWIRDSANPEGAVWHLQDDVIVSRDFAEITGRDYDGIVCGFCNPKCDLYPLGGVVSTRLMWFSMQCMRIPNRLAGRFLRWFRDEARYRATYADKVEGGKDDDFIFKGFLVDEYPDMKVLNLEPNIVDHIDWLIGGSVVNAERKEIIRARYWSDESLVEELESRLKEEGLAPTPKKKTRKTSSAAKSKWDGLSDREALRE